MVVRLRERFSVESIEALPSKLRLLVVNAEAEMDFGDPLELKPDLARIDCFARKNWAWRELEKMMGVH
jgi:hypothetical protein